MSFKSIRNDYLTLQEKLKVGQITREVYEQAAAGLRLLLSGSAGKNTTASKNS
jgi:hypothetical protein